MDSQSILELLYEDDVEFVDKIPMKPVGNTVSTIAVSTTSTAHTMYLHRRGILLDCRVGAPLLDEYDFCVLLRLEQR